VALDKAYLSKDPDAEAGDYVMLAVSDTGEGMDAATQARIFEPFFTTKEQGRGTGLGLATVHGIVKQHHGLIWVYSELGKGSTFKIYLPRSRGEAEAEAPAAPPLVETRGSESLLVAEDDPQVRELSCGILSAAGYKVSSSSDPLEALKLAENLPDLKLLVTDVVMPHMDGRDLARRLQAKRPGLRVLYLSGYASGAIVDQGVLEPGLDFLEKPYSPPELRRKVREILDRPEGKEKT
jgi:CheY-like chemotaxis protein